MKILITGAFGNLGKQTIDKILEKKENHQIFCLDIKNRRTKKVQKQYLNNENIYPIWGSVSDSTILEKTIIGKEIIIHLAGILHPYSEKNPELARIINLESTRQIIMISESQKIKPKLIFASSVSIYGPTNPNHPLLTSETPVNPIDVYTKTKVEAEKLIKSSNIPWLILRVSAAPPLHLVGMENIKLLYEMPLNQKLEFAHTSDVGLAFTNAAFSDLTSKILLISGGLKNRMINSKFLTQYFTSLGIGMISENAFKQPKNEHERFYTHWMDTKDSQNLLDYQTLLFSDYLSQMKKFFGWKLKLFKLFRPIIKKFLLMKSPYYKVNSKKK